MTVRLGITVMRLSRGGYLIREGFRSIGTHGFMSFASVTIIAACLIIMGSVSLLSLNIDKFIGELENENEVVAFIDEELTEEEAKAVQSDIEAVANISSAEFVSRKEAMDNYMSNFDDSFSEGIDETVFRHRFVIHLTDIALMAQSKVDLEAVSGVAKVKAHLEYAKTFITIRNIVSVISLVLTVILVFVSVFIMSNTIKLATFGRREEIAIMKMVGATNSFIRMPFIVEGLVLGILGGGLGFLATWGLYDLVTGKVVESITGSFINVIPFLSIWMEALAVYGGIGILVGVFGGENAISNYLKV